MQASLHGLGVAYSSHIAGQDAPELPPLPPLPKTARSTGWMSKPEAIDVNLCSSWDFCCDGLPSFWIAGLLPPKAGDNGDVNGLSVSPPSQSLQAMFFAVQGVQGQKVVLQSHETLYLPFLTVLPWASNKICVLWSWKPSTDAFHIFSTLLTRMWRTRSVRQTWDWCKHFCILRYGLGVAYSSHIAGQDAPERPPLPPVPKTARSTGWMSKPEAIDVNLCSSWDFCCDGLPSFWIASTKGWWQRRCQRTVCVPAIAKPAGHVFCCPGVQGQKVVLPSNKTLYLPSLTVIPRARKIISHQQCPAHAGAEVSKIGSGYRKPMAYGKVCAMQKQWIVQLFKLWGASTNEQMVVEMRMEWHENPCTTDRMSQWINESMNEWFGESMSQWTDASMMQWINDSVSQCINQRFHDAVNQCMSELVSRWADEAVNQWSSESQMDDEPMSQWIDASTSRRCSDPTNEWISQSMNQWTNAKNEWTRWISDC